ncbi:MAG: response regulator [Prolixibacteraceae bacterium]|jgi:DNA-binding NtrC family response regulator|nr:response regulator [Prolixibacteraceae bacterium]
MNDEKIKIFLVDDDSVYLKLLEIELLSQGDFDIETYATGELCIEKLSHSPDVIVLDYYLDGIQKNAMTGIETLDKIKAVNPEIAVIVLSGQDSIDIAVSCMHHKAFDYVVKSETAFLRLKKIIPAIFQYKKMEKQLKWYMERM